MFNMKNIYRKNKVEMEFCRSHRMGIFRRLLEPFNNNADEAKPNEGQLFLLI